jgi:hypothetical protein
MTGNEHPRIELKLIPTPWAQHIINAPPVLVASTNTVDYTCAYGGAILMHAEERRVHNLVISCAECGSFSSTDG